jgi:biotin carboxyl carrier protein
MDKQFKVSVNDSFEFDLKSSDAKKLDVLKLSKSKFHLINNNKSYNVELVKDNFKNREYIVTINSNSYTIKISTPLDALIKVMGFSLRSTKKAKGIKAPMPGIILSVNVKEGQKVKEGDTLLILEAMKLENTIAAPKDGIIKTINAKSGGTVNKGELMIEMA